ncbi:MAG: 2-oxoglutarate dehydrogenase complex dihydrolipoyllysine-residue succinyltransferase [Hyphomicrobiales bacterium]
MSNEIRVPTLGESVSEATIGQWHKKVGDAVRKDEPIVELETDKVTLDVPASATGVLAETIIMEGETVAVGALLGTIAEGEASGASPETAAQPVVAAVETNESSKGGSMIEVVAPSAGESVTEADIGSLYVKVGDVVNADDALFELETDKAALEVVSPVSGKIAQILHEEGATIAPGDVVLLIEEGAAGDAPAAPAASAPAPAAAAPAPVAAGTDMPPAPSAAKMMAENNVDAGSVAGSGKRGQVLKGDVMDAMASGASSSAPAAAAAPRGPVSADDEVREERVKMTRLRQTIARRLKDAQNSAAMLTTYNEVDMKPVMDLRKQYKDLFEKKHGVKLGFMGFFAKAVCHALKEIPAVNAEIDGKDIVYKNFAHIGVAVGTPKGLVVPVVRDADEMSIAEIEKEIGRLGAAGRDGKLGMDDMQGGTFTISNGGVYGSLMSSPILNAPQSGILGMHKIQERPVVVGGEIVIRPMMYLALSYDHRIVDGKEAVTFLVRVKESLEDPQRLVLDL